MGKKSKQNKQIQNSNFDSYPLVSICTPTFNRRPFIPTMIKCIQNQTYPKEKMEWIIVDDGTDKIGDLLQNIPNIPTVKYFPLNEKLTLGKKRNFTHSKCEGSFIVYIDDDDYYPPERVSHAVETLQANRNALCAGSSEIYVYFKHIQAMYKAGPYGPNHATAGTFAFRKELLSKTQYNESASLAEEREFLKNYTIPFVQLDPMKTILVFSHNHNTFDKRKLLDNKTNNQQLFQICTKVVNDFIRNASESDIKNFFLHDIDAMLEKYKYGDPIMKPDVLKQIKQIEAQREAMKQQNVQIMIQEEGKPQRPLTMVEIAELLKRSQAENTELKKRLSSQTQAESNTAIIEQQAKKINVLESLVAKLREEIKVLQTNSSTVLCKSMPEVEVALV